MAPAFVAVLVPALVIFVLGAASPWIALALVPFLVAVGLSPFLMRSRVDRLGSRAREAAGELGAYAIDSVQGLGEIVSFQDERGARTVSTGWPTGISRFACLSFGNHSAGGLLEVFTGLGALRWW